jgi:hypothetical protein
VNASPSQFATQFILAGHSIAGQHFTDYIQALGFHSTVTFATKQRRGPLGGNRA